MVGVQSAMIGHRRLQRNQNIPGCSGGPDVTVVTRPGCFSPAEFAFFICLFLFE